VNRQLILGTLAFTTGEVKVEFLSPIVQPPEVVVLFRENILTLLYAIKNKYGKVALTMKTYVKPRLRCLGLLRLVTKFSF